jgi:hypothetical protein
MTQTKVPGDVVVGTADSVIVLSAEAKQKVVTDATIMHRASRIAVAGIPRAIYGAFGSSQPPLDAEALAGAALDRHGVLLTVFTDARALLCASLLWTSLPLETALVEFPGLVAKRLVEFGCTSASGEEWPQSARRWRCALSSSASGRFGGRFR